jgi:hypothetical protein
MDVGTNIALQELSAYLEKYDKMVLDYELPKPVSHMQEVEHELVHWGRDPYVLSLHSHDTLRGLKRAQHKIYGEILFAVTNKQHLRIFVSQALISRSYCPTHHNCSVCNTTIYWWKNNSFCVYSKLLFT